MTTPFEAPATTAEVVHGSEPLRRAFSVLELIATKPDGLTASVIADDLDLPQASAFRLVRRLVELDLLTGTGRNGTYTIGPRMNHIAHLVAGERSLAEIAGPIVQQVADELGVAAYLAGLYELEALLLLVRVPVEVRAPFVHPGRQFRVHASAGGKALIAFQPKRAIEQFLRKPLARLTDRTITDREAFRRHLDEIRVAGFAVSSGESDPNLWGIAFPVLDQAGTAVYSIGFISFHLPTKEEAAFIGQVSDRLARAAKDLGEWLNR